MTEKQIIAALVEMSAEKYDAIMAVVAEKRPGAHPPQAQEHVFGPSGWSNDAHKSGARWLDSHQLIIGELEKLAKGRDIRASRARQLLAAKCGNVGIFDRSTSFICEAVQQIQDSPDIRGNINRRSMVHVWFGIHKPPSVIGAQALVGAWLYGADDYEGGQAIGTFPTVIMVPECRSADDLTRELRILVDACLADGVPVDQAWKHD